MFKLIVPLLSLLITVSGCTQMVVIPEAKGPYDPRPLMAKLTAKNKDNKDRMHFLVFGDSKHSPRLQTVLKRADALTPEFCITTADLVNTGGGSQGVKDYQKLDKEAGWFFKKYPTWPSVGNHELSESNNNNADPGHDLDGYDQFASFFGINEFKYSFSYGNATFIALDWPKIQIDTPEYQWLESTLKAAQGTHIFIFKHRPYYTVGSKKHSDVEGKTTAVTKLFSKYNVAAVFSGHDHTYYRTKRDGVYYIVSAGAGASIYKLKRIDEAIEGDVYYGVNTKGSKDKGNQYLYHSDQGTKDITFNEPMYFVSSVDIAGESITFKMIQAANGKVWDTITIDHPLN